MSPLIAKKNDALQVPQSTSKSHPAVPRHPA